MDTSHKVAPLWARVWGCQVVGVPKAYIHLGVAILGRVGLWKHVREGPEGQGPTPGSAKTKLVTEEREALSP